MTSVEDWLADARIAVVGLGYVGLPLAVELGKHYPVLGYDLRTERIEALRAGIDETREVDTKDLRAASGLLLTDDPYELAPSNVYIITVPTPIDAEKQPDLGPLRSATNAVAAVIRPGGMVIYESTVYPGCIEDVCVPMLEAGSGLVLNRDFNCGYSPERINPGDHEHRLADVRKIVSGSSPVALNRIDALYSSIITAGTYRAESIRVAEAAKVIENTQRDLNIALVNELAMIFARLGIDTEAVLRAAETKWNFMPFRPGLVGGHCIGVDPYYLVHCAEATGHDPQVILAGRRINDSMGSYVADRLALALTQRGCALAGARVLVMGLAFKENCPDSRNSRVIDVIARLEVLGASVDVYDPWVVPSSAYEEFGLRLVPAPEAGAYDAIVLAVAHREFRAMPIEAIRWFGRECAVIFDVKSIFPEGACDLRL